MGVLDHCRIADSLPQQETWNTLHCLKTAQQVGVSLTISSFGLSLFQEVWLVFSYKFLSLNQEVMLVFDASRQLVWSQLRMSDSDSQQLLVYSVGLVNLVSFRNLLKLI